DGGAGMNRKPLPSDMTPEAVRYLDRMRSLEPPIDLVDRIMAEVEATPQLRPGLVAVPPPMMVAATVAAAAAVLLAFALLVRLAPNVGPAPSPSPGGARLPTAGTVLHRFPTISTYRPAVVGHGFLWMEDAVRGNLIRVHLDT